MAYLISYDFRKPAKKGVWSEEEVEQLRALYEEYKNSIEEQGNCQCFPSSTNVCWDTVIPVKP